MSNTAEHTAEHTAENIVETVEKVTNDELRQLVTTQRAVAQAQIALQNAERMLADAQANLLRREGAEQYVQEELSTKYNLVRGDRIEDGVIVRVKQPPN